MKPNAIKSYDKNGNLSMLIDTDAVEAALVEGYTAVIFLKGGAELRIAAQPLLLNAIYQEWAKPDPDQETGKTA